jgi:hypothetical protein
MRVYQIWDNFDPAVTDSFYRTKREAEKAAKEMGDPSEVIEHNVDTSKSGLIEALTTIPKRCF